MPNTTPRPRTFFWNELLANATNGRIERLNNQVDTEFRDAYTRNNVMDEFINLELPTDDQPITNNIPPKTKNGATERKLKKKTTITKHMPNIMNPYKRCSGCGNTYLSSDMYTIENHKYTEFCFNCIKGFKKCSKCNAYIQGDTHCCKPPKGAILEYNFQSPITRFKHNESDNILFGIELEIEFGSNPEDKMSILKNIDKLEYIYFKRDGSLSKRGDGGVEIVTHPLGWQWLKINPNAFSEIFSLSDNKCTSRQNRTCGMHVHIAKNIWGTFQIYKLIKFFIENPTFIHQISGRSWDNLMRWAQYAGLDGKNAKRISKNKTNPDKHIAINLKNPETIEIRIFNGTLSPHIFYKNIEFVKALYDFTNAFSLKDMTTENFKDYVSNNKKEFPNLHWFLFTDIKKLIMNGEV